MFLPSGQGGFQSYVHKIRNAQSFDCVFCSGIVDDADHTFFLAEGGMGLVKAVDCKHSGVLF